MSSEIQRPLPGLEKEQNPRKSAAVILITFENDIPYFLSAERRDRNGRTLLGGKLEEGETPEVGVLREALEETEVKIFSAEDLISAHPKREYIPICDNGSNFNAHIYFAYFDETAHNQIPKNLEPDKHGEWTWQPLSDLSKNVAAGELHTVVIQDFMMEEIGEIIELQRLDLL